VKRKPARTIYDAPEPPRPEPFEKGTIMVALYARVSTRDKGQDPEMQLREMRQYCERRGWKIYHEFVDVMSGAIEERPQLQILMKAVSRRYCDVVMVYKLDRFGRSMRHLVNALAEFEALGVKFVSVHDDLDFTTAMGRLLFHVVAAIAEFERDMISERVCSGMAHAKSKGIHVGRPTVKTGEIVDRILSLRDSGASWRTISNQVGISHSTAKRIASSLKEAM